MSDEGQQYDVPAGHKSGFVTIVGRPNVGKSTLLNAYMQQKIAIVTPRPQTTRIRQLGIITEEHYQMIFVDTPGLMKPRHKLDEFMVDAAMQTLADADVILWMVDGSQPVGAGDRIIAGQMHDLQTRAHIILGINKGDLLNPTEIIIQTEAYQALLPDAPWILFSAQAGNGRDELYQMIIDALPEGPRYFPADQITDIFVRDIAAELIREQIMLQLREEIPYGVAVQVTEFKERENGVTYVNATVITEKENHKQIIIGAQGKQLRALGASAREEIEDLVRGKVFLDLWVKVDTNWRRNDRALRRLGYSSPQ